MLRSVLIVVLITLLAVACSSPAATSVPTEPADESSVPIQDDVPVEDAAVAAAVELGDFASAPDMKARRERFAAITLSDGRVLAVGGRGLGIGTLVATIHETAEVLDTETLEWTFTGPMAEGRRSPAVVELADGRVLAAGGLGPTKGTILTAEIWDPAENAWTSVAPMHMSRDGMGAVRLLDGRVMVVGGKTDDKFVATLDQSEIYDVGADTWTEAPPMSEKRVNHTVTLLLDGRVLVTGGGKEDGPFSKTAETYDPDTDTWTTVAPMTVSRSFHTATLLDDGRVLVVGGRGKRLVAELYDPTADMWSSAGETEVARAEHRAVLLLDGRVLVTGGLGSLAESEIYDPAANEWSTGSPLQIGRFRHVTVLLPDGRVVTIGGTGPDGILASSEVLASR